MVLGALGDVTEEGFAGIPSWNCSSGTDSSHRGAASRRWRHAEGRCPIGPIAERNTLSELRGDLNMSKKAKQHFACTVDKSRLPRAMYKAASLKEPIGKLALLILNEAVHQGAESIRISGPAGEEVQVEYLIDGEWRTVESPSRRLLAPLVCELLVLSRGGHGIPLVKDKKREMAWFELESAELSISVPDFSKESD